MFSRDVTADQLFTLGDFAIFLEKRFKPDGRPVVAVVNKIVDWKGLLGDCLNSFKGLKRPHAFRFKLCESKSNRFVGMQYREFASEVSTPWLGHKGSTNDADAIPMFSSLPRTSGTLPLCNDPVHLSPTLEKNVTAFEDYFSGANSLFERKTPDLLGTRTIQWFRSVIDSKTLGASLSEQSPGVGSAATLPAPVFNCDAAVRLVGAEATIPDCGPRPPVVAQPDWASAVTRFQLSLPDFPEVERKVQDRAKKDRAKVRQARKAKLEALKATTSSASSNTAAGSNASPESQKASAAAGCVMDIKEDKPAARRKRRRASSAHSDAKAQSIETANANSGDGNNERAARTVKQQRSAPVSVLPMDDKRDADLLCCNSFSDVQNEIAKGHSIDVVCAVSGRAQRVWRVSHIEPDEATQTFSVGLYQFRDIGNASALAQVPARRLRRHSALVPSD